MKITFTPTAVKLRTRHRADPPAGPKVAPPGGRSRHRRKGKPASWQAEEPAKKLAAGTRQLVRIDRPDAARLAAYAAKLGVKHPNADQRNILERFAFTMMPQGQVLEMLMDVAD